MNSTIHKLPSVLPRQAQIAPPTKRPLRGLIWIVVLLILGTLYWFVFHSTVFSVTSVELSGADDPAVKAISQQLVGQNIFSIRTIPLEEEIRQVYPSVYSISLVRGIPNRLKLMVQLRTPALRWQTNNEVFTLDSNGESFERGEKSSYGDLAKVIDYSNVPVTVGQSVILPAFIDFINEVKTTTTPLFGKTILAYEVHGSTFHLELVLDGDIHIRLTTQRPSKEQLEAAQMILLAHPEAKMIDVRVPGRGYYK